MRTKTDDLEETLTQPIEPKIECDGWYAICAKCYTEITPNNALCPKCMQLQDWSWFSKYKKEEN